MKKGATLFFVSMSILFILSLIYASNFSDILQSDFNLGNYSNTSYNGVGVVLNGSNLSGVYLSRVFDATGVARWNNSTFVYQSPYLDKVFGIDSSAEVWKSSDSGYNWTMINSDYTGSDGNGLVEMSVNSSGSFFATYNQQLYKSDNFGISWVKTNTDINGAGDSNAMVAMAIDNLNNIFIIDNSEDVLKSTDSGATFVKVNNTNFNGANGAVFGMVSSSSGILFAVDVQSDVWKSTNLGVSWQLTKDDYNGAAGNGGNDLIINSTDALFIIDGQDIWQSIDSGVTWIKINDDFNMGSDTNNGVTGTIDKNNTFYIADGSEDIYKSIDSGITFTRTIQNLNGAPGNILGLIAFREHSNLTFQVRNCSLSNCSDGIWQTRDLNNLNLTGRYFQYKADFSSPDNNLSPKLYNVSLDYTILDNIPPQFSDYTENSANNSAYVFGQSYGFNATITDNSAVGNVWIEFNGVNYALGISNISNVYTFIKNNLAAGTYSYKWWANDSYGNLNSSEMKYYTVSKADPAGNMLITGTSPITYGTSSDFIETETNLGDGECVYSIDKINGIYSAGTYVFNYSTIGCENYSSGSVVKTLQINKATPVLSLLINGSSSDSSFPINVDIPINASAVIPSGFNVDLYEDNVLKTNGVNISYIVNYASLGNRVWKVNISENENYTSLEKSYLISILDANGPQYDSSLKENPEDPVTYSLAGNYEFNITWTDDLGISEVILDFDGVNYSLSQGQLNKNGDVFSKIFSSLAAGVHNYKWHANDTSNNWVSTPVQTYTINKNVAALFLVMPVGNSITYNVFMNITCSANNPESIPSLTRNTLSVSNPDNTVLGVGSYNYACTSIATENYTSASNTGSLTVTKATPTLNLTLNGQGSDITLPSSGGEVNMTARLINPQNAIINLTLNGIIIGSGLSSIENISLFSNSGSYNVGALFDGNENYTSGTLVSTITVSSVINNGGGNNGGNGGSNNPVVIGNNSSCSSNWVCGSWTECTIEGVQIRACTDKNNCGVLLNKPLEIQSCTRPNCSDGIRNNGELGVDCGGPCINKCKTSAIQGQVIAIPFLNKGKTKYLFLLMAGLLIFIFFLILLNRFEKRLEKKKNIPKYYKILANILHILIIISILLLVYYIFK